MGDTIAALSSGRPPAAIGVIRISGPAAFPGVERLAGKLPPPRHAALRRLRDPETGEMLDEALVLCFPGPSSSTGEDIVEIQCHGGRAVVDAILGRVVETPGVRVAEPGEFTRRALANGRIDLTEAEGLADLLAAETDLQRQSAMLRVGGAMRRKLDDWRERLLQLSARAEVAIDYADEEDGAADDDLRPDLAVLAAEMGKMLETPAVEPLREGVRVVVAGPPNAGKSSLINVLTNSERVIVTPIAGTTRDVVEVPLSIRGIPMILVDTAGIRDSDDSIERIGIDRAQGELERADLILWLGEAEDRPDHGYVIDIQSKIDICSTKVGSALGVSALTGAGITGLLEEIAQRAARLLPSGDQLALDRRERALLLTAMEAIERAGSLNDPLLVAEELRVARSSVDAISGRTGVEDLLDALFGRFCLGK